MTDKERIIRKKIIIEKEKNCDKNKGIKQKQKESKMKHTRIQ